VARPPAPTPYFADFVEGRRGEILDAALAVFREKGYEGGTMWDIASRLGVTEPALYRHYAGKEAMYADLLGLAGDRVVETFMGRMADVSSETLRASLMGLISKRGHRESGMGGMLGTLIAAAPHNKTLIQSFHDHFALPMVQGIHEFVPRVDAFFGVDRTPAELDSAVRMFTSLFVGYFATSKTLAMPDDDGAIVDAMLLVMGWSTAEPARH
jgi:AcrR family transcriptional regulator